MPVKCEPAGRHITAAEAIEAVARACPALLVRGRVERSEGSMTLVAERFEPLPLGPVPGSRDFR